MKKRYENELKIGNISFDNGLIHISFSEEKDIPNIIKYSKHTDRHFAFYNCKVSKFTIVNDYSFINKKRTKYFKYEISYEKKFTSKFIDDVESKFLEYVRNKKIESLI